MKKIISIFLVALTALGLTATVNKVYATENTGPIIDWSDEQDYFTRELQEMFGVGNSDTSYSMKSTDTLQINLWNKRFRFNGVQSGDPDNDQEWQFVTFKIKNAVIDWSDEQDYFTRELQEMFGVGNSDTSYSMKSTDTLQINLWNKRFRFNGVQSGDPDNDQEWQFVNFKILPIGEDLRPAINGQETFATKVDEARPVEYFIGFLKAIDDIDGDISDDIYIVTDNYTPNKSVLGTHAVTVGVEDSSGNVSEFTFKVSVVDIDAPIITGNATAVSIGYKETYNIANFKSTLTVTDNYDTLSASDITIKSDNYTTNKTKLGTWNVVFEVSDSSGNTSTFTKPIKVIDNVAPVFSGIETLTKSYTEVMTLSDIVAQVTANDEIDGNLTNKISVVNDGFTGKSNKVGTHYIELSVSDNAGNTTTRTITIKVIDDQLPGWFITNGVSINLTPGTELTRTQIVELLHKSGQVLAPANARITYLTDTYSDNVGMPGTYTLAFRTVLTNGQENTYTYAVNVLDDKTEEDTEVLPGLPFYEENKILIWSIGGAGLLAAAYFVFKKKKK